MKPEAEEWSELARMDLEGADILLAQGLWPLAVFHSHQAVEKLLKAVWVERATEGAPPRTHDLLELLVASEIELPEWREFLGKLSDQAVESRYAGPAAYSEDDAWDYVRQATSVCEVLRQQLS